MNELRIATRRSPLALAQAGRVAALLATAHPDVSVRLVEVEAAADRDSLSPVAGLGLGAFVRAVQQAVCDGRADLAVHSLKDLPTSGPEDLVVCAPERDSPWDVVVGAPLDRLPANAVVGTGSPRRVAQLQLLRPDLATAELRGNIDTRLLNVKKGDVDAAILAEAGLRRMGRDAEIAQILSLEEMVPAPGQGALAVETKKEGDAAELVAAIDDPKLAVLLEAERLLLAATGAGCRAALGALARWEAGRIRFDVFVSNDWGPRRGVVFGDSPSQVVEAARKELGL
jgi:hydroxymethylbilane synthase